MMEGLTLQQSLCLHLLHRLCLGYSLPAEREAPLGVMREHLSSLSGEAFAPLRMAAKALLAAQTPVEWTFATNEVARALVHWHRAAACRIIAGLSAKRVA